MIHATIRLLTAIVVIVMSGIAVAQGWGIVRFFLAGMNIVSSEKRAEFADALRARSGIISTALLDDLADETNRSDVIAAYRQHELLSAILSIKPMSSTHWLSLSSAELSTHRPMEDVLGSLRLSLLTGPNEGYLMAERGIFVLSLWEKLPPDLKRHEAIDLGPLTSPRTPEEAAESGKFRAVLATKPESVRSELREALVATGLSPKVIEQQLGF